MLKAPTNLVVAELAGQWHGFNLITPSLLEISLSQNLVVDLRPVGRFLARLGSLSISADGIISGNMGGAFGIEGARDFEIAHDLVSVGQTGQLIGLAEWSVGSVTLGTGGLVRATGTNLHGETFSRDLWTNAGYDVLAAIETS